MVEEYPMHQLAKYLLGTIERQKNRKASMQERSNIAECEKEQICLLATQIKLQRGTIRHFKSMTEGRINEIEKETEPRSQYKKPGLPSRKFPSIKLELKEPAKPKMGKKMRQKEEILIKMKNNLPLSRSNERK